ncbi:MAG: VOC family protein [Myxococcales bacterium]|nr:VOC family protein [Myxococcales bacterium]MCB9540369.1 VOC family protein [Myxococcales bacterium]
MSDTHPQTLTPRLVVRNAPAAIDFYTRVYGAELLERYAMPDGHVVHALLALGDARFSLAEEAPDWHTLGAQSIGDSPVILQLSVDDPDATAARAVELGAEVVFPIRDQFYGRREGRIRDPFGHLWILGRVIEDVSPEEMERRIAAFAES